MQKKIFSLLVLLMTAVTGAWAQTPELLVTIQSRNSGLNSGSMTFGDKAIVTFSNSVRNDNDEWGWYSYFGEGSSLLTVTSVEGYTITSCKFYVETDGPAVNGYTIEGESPSVFLNETKVYTDASQSVFLGIYGITKIEVYGYEGSPAPASTTNYYLVGTMNDWGASKQFLLTPNPGNAAEYMITLNLKAGTELKVIGVDAQNNATWYPSGDNYYVNTAGQYTVYFRPDGSGDQGQGWHQGCIYLDPAPAPAVPLTDLGSGQWQFQMPSYAVVAKIEYDTELELQEENVNTAVLADWHGYEADITLQRTLKAGSWNTLAVPFNVSSQMLGHLTSTYGMQVKQLATVDTNGEHITLNFTDATQMEAGKPYLVKVTSDFDFSAQALPNVEVSKELHPVTTTYIDFIPTLGKTTIEGVDAENILFVAAENKLKNPKEMPAYMKGFRAYFQLKNLPADARTFALNIGGEATGIEHSTLNIDHSSEAIYDLQGRKVNGQSSMVNGQLNKGVYIQNGKKTVVK